MFIANTSSIHFGAENGKITHLEKLYLEKRSSGFSAISFYLFINVGKDAR